MTAAFAELFAEHGGGAGAVLRGVHVGLEGALHDAAVLRKGTEHDLPFARAAAAHRNLQRHWDLAFREVLFEFTGERGVDIAVEAHPLAETVGALAADCRTIAHIAPESHYRRALDEGEAVAVMEFDGRVRAGVRARFVRLARG